MNKIFTLSAISIALSLVTFSANANLLTYDYIVGQTNSTQAGAVIETFATSLLPSGYTGGAVFNTTTFEHATPAGSDSYYYSIGATGGQTGPGVVTFANPSSYFGFLWGSPDLYNHVTFYSGETVLGTFDGSAVLQPTNGDQAFSAYFNVYANSPLHITSVQFESAGGNAFETDNHAYISAVPEPETYAMMLAGLGIIGAIARRRKI